MSLIFNQSSEFSQMKRSSIIAAALMISISSLPAVARGDAPADIISACKRSIAKVYNRNETGDIDGAIVVDSAGTAICISRSGYFVTDEHVVHNLGDVRIAVEMAPHYVCYFDAKVVSQDTKLDLAILKVDNEAPFTPLSITEPAELKHGMHVTAIGYPTHGDDIDPKSLAWYTPSVHGGFVKQLIGVRTRITDVITDTGIGHGASGCPLINDRGKLVGILQRGKSGTNLNLSKSAAEILKYLSTPKINEMIQKPDIQFVSVPDLQSTDLAHEMVFKTRIIDGISSIKAATATVTVHAFPDASRSSTAAIRSDGQCDFHVQDLTVGAQQFAVALTTAPDANGRHRNLLARDRDLSIGSRQVNLSEVSRIELTPDPVVILQNGERIGGRVKGIESVEALIDGKLTTVDLSGERILAARNRTAPPRVVHVDVQISRGGKVLNEASRSIAIQGLPAAQHGQSIVIACGSAWATNNTGVSTGSADHLSAATRRYIRNIMEVMVGGAPSNVLILSDHWTFGTPFQQVLKALGHQVTAAVDTSQLDQYDAVFVGGREVDQQALAGYVQRGGKVYLSGGADAAGGQWNDFLHHFGLYSQSDTIAETAPGSGFEYSPLFDGVSGLTINKLYNIVRTKENLLEAQTICANSCTNAWAIYKSKEKLGPTPAQRAASAAIAAAIEAAEAKKTRAHEEAIRLRTVDEVFPGITASETAHNLTGENLVEGEFEGSHYRGAGHGGSFSYTLRIDPAASNNLLFTIGWTTGRKGSAVLFINDKFFGSISLDVLRARPGYMYQSLFEIPPRITTGLDHLVLRFQGEDGSNTAQLFQCKITRSVPGYSDKPKPIISTAQRQTPEKQIDSVVIGDTDSETRHELTGDKSETGVYLDRHWRASTIGGWFSYTLKTNPVEKAALVVNYSAANESGHDFDIQVDGKRLATVLLRKEYGNRIFHSEVYAIPEGWTRNKSSIVVRFSAHPSNIAGGIDKCQIVER